MSITYTTKSNRLSVVLLAATVTPSAGQSIDANSGFGQLVIGTSALSGATGVLVTITLPKPSFSISGGVATLLGVPLSGNPSASGTAAKAELRDSAGTTIALGLTVGLSASSPDIVLNTVTIAVGIPVTITSGTITEP